MNLTLTLDARELEQIVREAVRDELRRMRASDELLDYDGAAQLLAVTPHALRALVKRRALPFVKLPTGRVRFEREPLLRWAKG
jgi:excisionase family DNA binding protein